MPFSISISGIDWCWKTSTIAGMSEEIWKDYLTAKIGRPSYIIWPWQEKEILTNLTFSKIENYRPVVNQQWIRPFIAWLNAIYAINQWFLTRTVIKLHNPNIIINERDIIIDSIIYSNYYIPPSRHISSNIKIQALKLITWSNLPDSFIYMDIDPQNSLDRILKRWEPLTKHENIKELKRLRNHYEEIIGYLYGHTSTKVYAIDVNELTLEQAIESMTKSIKEQLS